MSNYQAYESTAQRVLKYLSEHYTGEPQFFPYSEIAAAIGRTRSAVSYAVGVLLRAGEISIEGGKIALKSHKAKSAGNSSK